VGLNHYQKYGRKWYLKNKESELVRAKKSYKKNRPKRLVQQRKSMLIYRYGITEEDYNQMLKSQSGRCGICGDLPKTNRKLDVDHCHKENKVRGLLCNSCNQGIGYLKDSIDILKRAIKYLKT